MERGAACRKPARGNGFMDARVTDGALTDRLMAAPLEALMAEAAGLRDGAHGAIVFFHFDQAITRHGFQCA